MKNNDNQQNATSTCERFIYGNFGRCWLAHMVAAHRVQLVIFVRHRVVDMSTMNNTLSLRTLHHLADDIASEQVSKRPKDSFCTKRQPSRKVKGSSARHVLTILPGRTECNTPQNNQCELDASVHSSFDWYKYSYEMPIMPSFKAASERPSVL